jgi:hypothetical protein
MKKTILIVLCLFSISFGAYSDNNAFNSNTESLRIEQENDHAAAEGEHDAEGLDSEEHISPPGWSIIPFALLLVMIATGPLFYENFWHKNYPIVAVSLAALVVLYYLFIPLLSSL